VPPSSPSRRWVHGGGSMWLHGWVIEFMSGLLDSLGSWVGCWIHRVGCYVGCWVHGVGRCGLLKSVWWLWFAGIVVVGCWNCWNRFAGLWVAKIGLLELWVGAGRRVVCWILAYS